MILLMTYYVSHTREEGEPEKIYIIHFFKKNPVWKDNEYWESVLLECIYLEKRNTINMMIVSELGTPPPTQATSPRRRNSSRRKDSLYSTRSSWSSATWSSSTSPRRT
jgi:hypothetical protein